MHSPIRLKLPSEVQQQLAKGADQADIACYFDREDADRVRSEHAMVGIVFGIQPGQEVPPPTPPPPLASPGGDTTSTPGAEGGGSRPSSMYGGPQSSPHMAALAAAVPMTPKFRFGIDVYANPPLAVPPRMKRPSSGDQREASFGQGVGGNPAMGPEIAAAAAMAALSLASDQKKGVAVDPLDLLPAGVSLSQGGGGDGDGGDGGASGGPSSSSRNVANGDGSLPIPSNTARSSESSGQITFPVAENSSGGPPLFKEARSPRMSLVGHGEEEEDGESGPSLHSSSGVARIRQRGRSAAAAKAGGGVPRAPLGGGHPPLGPSANATGGCRNLRISQAAQALFNRIGPTASTEALQARAIAMFKRSQDLQTGPIAWTRGELLGEGASAKVYAGINQADGESGERDMAPILNRGRGFENLSDFSSLVWMFRHVSKSPIHVAR